MTEKITINKYNSFPKTEEIFQWIQDLCATPHRRTGTPEGRRSADYLAEEFSKIGLQDVKIEEVDSVCFDPVRYSLKVDGKEYPSFVINGTLHLEEYGDFATGSECCDAEIVYLHEGRESDFEGVDVEGKIVLCDCPWFDMDEDVYAREWCSEEAIIYDPDKPLREPLWKTDSYSPNAWPYNYIMAQNRGASGFIGVLTSYFEDGINWSEDYTDIGELYGCKLFKLPGVWIGVTAANEIKQKLTAGSRADLDVAVRYYHGKACNVSGELPGRSDDVVIVHSHHDAVFNGAVQDASGMSEVLALAKYYASYDPQEREKTLVFAGLDGHYTDYAGHKAFAKKMKNDPRKVVADVVIEHIGKDVGIDKDNNPVIRDEPDIRLLYVSTELGIVDVVDQAVRGHDLRRTVIMPVKPYIPPESGMYEFQQDEVISDAFHSHLQSIPVVSILSPQMYLFHPMDTPDMIPKEELVKVGQTFVEIVDHITQL